MVHLGVSLRELAGEPPAVLSFVCDPRVKAGAFVSHDLDREAVKKQHR